MWNYIMATNQTTIIRFFLQNICRHPNFWNLRNFKNRLHGLVLMMISVTCADAMLRRNYNMARKILVRVRGLDDRSISAILSPVIKSVPMRTK